MAQNNAIETGTESDDRADANAVEVSPDVWAFADDGEHATSWAVERVDDTTIRVEYHRHEAGLDDVETAGIVAEPVVEEFDVHADKTTEEFAQEVADANPEEAVKLAREHFQNK